MKKIITYLIGILILITSVSATDLSEYPAFMLEEGRFNAVFVVGDHASAEDVIGSIDVATSLQHNLDTQIPIGAAKLASEVGSVMSLNAVVIGGPCANAAASELMGDPANCLEGFVKGKGFIRLYENGDNVQMLIAGATALDTRKACRVLANYKDHGLSGDKIDVIGTNLLDIQITKND